MYLTRLAAIVVLGTGLAAPVNALTIAVPGGGTVFVPDATFLKIVCNGMTCIYPNTAGTTSFGGASAGIGVPFVSTSAAAAGGFQVNPGAEASAYISFVWIGPAGAGGSLPVDISVNMSTGFGASDISDPNLYVDAWSSFNLTNINSGFDWGTFGMRVECSGGDGVKVCDNNGALGTGQFSGTFQTHLTPNHVYTYNIDSNASGDSYFGHSNWNASASADPFIFLDPSFGDIGGYTLYLSSGIDNGFPPVNPPPSGVPEPSTLVLLGAGLTGVGVARRRKAHKRKA